MARKTQSADSHSEHILFDQPSVADHFTLLSSYSSIALAVSGGADSTALLLLVKRWIEQQAGRTPEITVLTVDHGLRAEAADEARWVGALSAQKGFRHETLVWSGEKPKTGLQAAARKARYRLMIAYCRAHGIPALVTAHHADDQAETFLMRLQRGSGVDGLAAMPPRSRLNGIDLIRPLLSVKRDQLRAFLRAEGQSWREDPSNRDEKFERIRLRNALKAAGEIGITSASLSLSAKRLLRARIALEQLTADFLQMHLKLDEAGFGTIAMPPMLDRTEEIGLRALLRMAAAFGGRKAVRLAKAESAYEKLREGASGLTLAGCHFSVRGGLLIASREYGRMPRMPIGIRDNMLWDGRFMIKTDEMGNASKDLTLRPLGPDGIRRARAAGVVMKKMPHTALLSLPSFWRGEIPCHIPFSENGGGPENWLTCPPKVTFANRDLLFSADFSYTGQA